MRKGARLNGKANVSELLIKSVRFDKPKVLTGLSQKAWGWIILLRSDYRDT